MATKIETIAWRQGMSYRDEQKFFEESLDAWNKEEKRINDEQGLLAKIFGSRKTPEPEQWSQKHDEMTLAFLTPQEKAQYQQDGYSREDMIAYAQDLILETAWKNVEKAKRKNPKSYKDIADRDDYKTKIFNRDPVHETMIVLKNRAALRDMKEEDWRITKIRTDFEQEKESGVLQKGLENAKGPNIAKNARLNRVKTMMCGCEIGKECVDFLNKEKCEVLFEPTDEGFAAFPRKGKLVMSPSFSDEEMAVLLMRGACLMNHEKYRYQAMLNVWDPIDKSVRGLTVENMKEQISIELYATRLKEFANADILAHEVRFAYEMKDKKPEIREEILDSPKNEGNYFRYDAKTAYQTYEKSLSEKKDRYQAMTAVVSKMSRPSGVGDKLYVDVDTYSDFAKGFCRTFAGKNYFKQIEPKNAVRFLGVKNWNKDGR
ncbi:MAG: hypothetical protein IKR09_09000 [Alphaproteobacteria bacterium]|nr:hypothetical protein [Alphaproteobacteria bacterium]